MKNDIFRRARLRLTAFYSLSIFLIVVLFSVGVYLLFDSDFGTDLEYEGQDSAHEEELQQQLSRATKQRLLGTLAIVDLGTLLLTISLSWFLSGKTLAPIRISLDKQKQFAADAAHELRTPLAVMKAGLETIESTGPAVADYRSLHADLGEEINRLVDLTNDLLFLSRSDQSSLPGALEKIDLAAITARQLEMIGPYAGKKGIQVSSDIQPGLSIAGDEGQISRLVLNLLKNSIDYNREGGEVNLSLARSGRKIVLEIADTGVGISPGELPHVFKRFYKTDKSRERSASGSGLGLAIAREIVKGHHGSIRLESQVGAGTKAIVSFDADDS